MLLLFLLLLTLLLLFVDVIDDIIIIIDFSVVSFVFIDGMVAVIGVLVVDIAVVVC